MSRFRLPNGDDHPEAATKHLLDSLSLLTDGRADGGAYLSGYVVECALKTLYHFQTGSSLRGHNLSSLTTQVNFLACVGGAKVSKYFKSSTAGIPTSPIAAWTPEMRYHAPGMTPNDAMAWYAIADKIYEETIVQLKLDGEL